MRAGDLVLVDFGLPVGSEPGFVRPAVVVTADGVLAQGPRTVHVVPVTTTARGYPTDIAVEGAGLDAPSFAPVHLCAVVGVERIADTANRYGTVGPVALAQIRTALADLLDLP